jgi:hypothetical protein
MATWTTNAVPNDNRGAEASNVGTLVSDFTSKLTITSITVAFTTSNGGSADCYIQQSNGLISQFGSRYTNNAAESHTYTGSKDILYPPFIVYIYSPTATALGVSIQYQGVTPVNGQEKSYYPKNVTPTYSSWTTPSCSSGYCAMKLEFEYTVAAAGTRLPPPPLIARF